TALRAIERHQGAVGGQRDQFLAEVKLLRLPRLVDQNVNPLRIFEGVGFGPALQVGGIQLAQGSGFAADKIDLLNPSIAANRREKVGSKSAEQRARRELHLPEFPAGQRFDGTNHLAAIAKT